jgi:hypothetical protein
VLDVRLVLVALACGLVCLLVAISPRLPATAAGSFVVLAVLLAVSAGYAWLDYPAAADFMLLPVLLAVILLYLPLVFAHAIQPGMFLTVFGGTLGCVLVFLLVYSIVYAFFFPAMQVLLARSGSTWQSADPRRLWKTARAHFIPYLLVFLIVGLALFNVMLVLAALTAFLLLPPLLVYAGLVSAHYAGQLGWLDKNKT